MFIPAALQIGDFLLGRPPTGFESQVYTQQSAYVAQVLPIWSCQKDWYLRGVLFFCVLRDGNDWI